MEQGWHIPTGHLCRGDTVWVDFFIHFFTSDIADLDVAKVDPHCSRAQGCAREVALLSPL